MTALPAIDAETVRLAGQGRLDAIDSILSQLQPGLYRLAVRMLGHREDARDACQEILLTVVAHLGGFRGEAPFAVWVYRIARRHLARAATRAREHPETSFDGIAERLAQGLFLSSAAPPGPSTPEDQAAAREVAVACTQAMTMVLDRDHRLAYLLATVFGLSAEEAASVQEIAPAAHRQRLSRARRDLHGFVGSACGLVDEGAPCRCERQVRPAAMMRARDGAAAAPPFLGPAERSQAASRFERLVRMGDAAAVFRAHPDYAPPEAMLAAIRVVLRREGYLADGRPEGAAS